MWRLFAAGLCAALWLVSPMPQAETLDVVFISPGHADEPFWRSVTRFMQPAARQLDIRLEILHAERDQLKMVDLVKQVGARATRPDYLILVNEKDAGGDMLKAANAAGIQTLLAFSKLDGAQATEHGAPREKYRHWLGSIVPNSNAAGRLTAEELVHQARRMRVIADDGKVHVAVIAGDRTTPTGLQRLQGAIDAFSADPSVVLEQVVHANWDRARAREQASALLLRYPRLNAFWTASDLTAYGAMEAAEQAGRTPGEDLLFSTINNSPAILSARLAGRIAALAGGHFTAGAWALVMLYDYHNGKDFRSEGLELQVPLFVLFDDERAQGFLARFAKEDFSAIDFRQYSKHLQPQLKRYQFGLLPILK